MKNEEIAKELLKLANELLEAEEIESEEKEAEIITSELQPLIKSNTMMLWTDKLYCANFELAVAHAKVRGKAGGSNFAQLVVDAHKGNGAVFFIDADTKEEALEKMAEMKPHRKYRNVYYCGEDAASSIGM